MRCVTVVQYVIIAVLGLFLASCGPSPYIAFTEAEGIKSTYGDPKLSGLNEKYRAELKDIYARYRQAGIGVYKEGVGFAKLSDKDGNDYYYLMVLVRPAEINFDVNTTTPEQRLSTVLKRHFEPNLRYLKADSLAKDDLDGLAFGVYWPVRDFKECNHSGGFLEYVVAYLKKSDVIALLNRNLSFKEAIREAEIVSSQSLKEPVPIRLVD